MPLTDLISKASSLATNATSVIEKASSVIPKAPTKDSASATLTNVTDAAKKVFDSAAPTAANASENAPTEADLSTYEKKSQALKAYYDIISSQKDAIRKKFSEGLDSYINTHFKVNNEDLNAFIQKTIFDQMNEYFKTINTSYLQHAFLLKIFNKRKDLILKVLEKSISETTLSNATISNATKESIAANASNILVQFKHNLAEIEQQHTILRGGNDPQKHISEVASWFPMDSTVNDVNRDLKLIIENVFIETMNDKNTLENTVNAMLSKHFHIFMDAISQKIQEQTIDVDVAILLSALSVGDVRDTFLQAVQQVLFETKGINETRGIEVNLAESIYDKIVTISNEKYKREISKKEVRGGNRKTKRTRKTRRTRRRMKKD